MPSSGAPSSSKSPCIAAYPSLAVRSVVGDGIVAVFVTLGIGGHELLAQRRFQALGDLGVVLEVLAGVFLALADALVVRAVPGARLLDQLGVHAHVDQLAFARDALAVQ